MQPHLPHAFLDWGECKSAPCFIYRDIVSVCSQKHNILTISIYGMGRKTKKVVSLVLSLCSHIPTRLIFFLHIPIFCFLLLHDTPSLFLLSLDVDGGGQQPGVGVGGVTMGSDKVVTKVMAMTGPVMWGTM